jgi:Protein of unknown function (DUF3237)
MRLLMHFDAGAPRYRWLNTNLFVARGRLVGSWKYRIRMLTSKKPFTLGRSLVES